MKFTPRPDLPPVLFSALTESKYQDELALYFRTLPEASRKLKAFSATTLSRAPRQRVLEHRWSKDVVADPVREKFWSLWGQLVHLLLEKQSRAKDIVEKRMGVDVGPFPDGSFIHIHGQPDCLYASDSELVIDGILYASAKEGDMDDWKVTTALSMMHGEKEDFVRQLNVNAWLARKHGHVVKRLRNVFIFRDWKASMVKEGSLYPKERLMIVEQPMWSDEKTEAFIMERAWLHAAADSMEDDSLPYCTPDERWQSLPLFKVIKLEADGTPQQNAKYSSNSMAEAEIEMNTIQSTEWQKILDKNSALKKPKDESTLIKPQYIIAERPSEPIKCSYCAGANWCCQLREDVIKGWVKQQEEGNE